MTHPELAWVEIQPSAVKIDGRREVRRVTEAAGLSLDAHDLDLAVQAFGDAVRDRVRDEAEDAVEVTLERGGHFLDRLEARTNGPPVPLFEEARDRRRPACRPPLRPVVRSGDGWAKPPPSNQ